MSIRTELSDRFGDNFSESIVERYAHSADLGFVPQLVWSGIKIKIIPDYVVYPETVEDVIDLVKIATKYKVPITPYGRGSNRYGNAIPTDGGITVDFSKMDKVVVNPELKDAVVGPGATWKLVDLYAQQKGMQLRTFPSSYDSSVGGGVAGDVLGIGSYEYGFICDNVNYVKMVNPKGEYITLSGNGLARVCGAEGTTGLITEIGLKLRPFSATEAMTIAFDSFTKAYDAIMEFYREAIPAWHVQVRGPSISSYVYRNFKAPLEPNVWNMVILYPAQRSMLVEPKIKRIANNLEGRIFEGEWTGWWSFNHGVVAALRSKGLLIHQHGLLSYTKLRDFVQSMEKNLGKLGDIDNGFDLDIDLERREVLLVNAFVQSELPPEDKKILYELAKNTFMMEEMIKAGGSMLSVGIFVHQYARNRLNAMGKTFQEKGVDRYEEIRKYKEENDPEELFNPGKVFDTKIRAKAVNDIVQKQKEALTFKFAVGLVKAVSRGGPDEGFKNAKKYMDIFADYAMKCIDCAMCVTVCPQYRLIPQMPYAPKGMFDFVKGAISDYHLSGGVDIPDSAIAELSGCHKCGLCDGVCPARIPISSLLVRLNSLVAKKMPKESPVNIDLVPPEYKDIIDENSPLILWIGRTGLENSGVVMSSLAVIKKLGLKVRIVGTQYDTGFIDFISGNGGEVINKIKQNAKMMIDSEEIVTISPEDYKMLSEAYVDYSKMSGVPVNYQTTPLEVLMLKSMDIRGDEEINLHLACFARGYADEVVRRLREKGFRVKKIEGCSGAQLEKSMGKRADKIAKAIGENYKTIVTMCPFAAIKFKNLGINAITLTEYLGRRQGIQVFEVTNKFTVPKEEEAEIRKIVTDIITKAITSKVNVIAETASFVSSGLDDYEKIIEPVISEMVDEMSREMGKNLRQIMSSHKEQANQIVIIKEYAELVSSILRSTQFAPFVEKLYEGIKGLTDEPIDEKIFKSALLDKLNEKRVELETIVVKQIMS
ncbi:FAD-linked oxidase [Sulfolobales archaeon HS-7]|nr:FAD-linked oxidase [Sulfolobales archaeon HS-7]